MVKKISILRGQDKDGLPENIEQIDVYSGEILAVIGPTGSGKTQLISDIEQYAEGDTPTGRRVLIDGLAADEGMQKFSIRSLVAEVSQNMNFVIDMTVEEFLLMHARVRKIADPEEIVNNVVKIANKLAGEAISVQDNITVLSGGQSRALMVADVALISNAPVVLIDEIENAGIDRLEALDFLTGQGKVVMVVTHDPMLTLMADRRLVMKNGGMLKVLLTGEKEKLVLERLMQIDKNISVLRNGFRRGETIAQINLQGEVEF